MARAWLAAARLLISVRRRLAWLAWRVGVPGAGLSYAVADDQWRLFRGRLPRYGVATYEQGGEVVVPLCDGTVSDQERRALGLPTRAELRRSAEVQNRLQAEERCRKEGLPDGVNLARVWCPTSAGSLKRMASEGTSVWRSGEDLTFVHRSRAAELSILPAIQLPMWRIEDDLWALSVRIRDLDRAAISYAFVSWGEPWPAAQTWRGPLAPLAPRRAAPLAGRLTEAFDREPLAR